MAQPFNLTAQINLRGPTNTRAIASQIRKQLSGIKVKIDLDVKGAEAKNIASINQQIQALSRNAKAASKDVSNLTERVRALGAGLSGMGATPAATALDNVKKQATTTGKAISVATSQIQEFGKQSGLAIRRFAAFSAVTGVVYSLTNAINSAFKEFIQFDKEIVRLSQVTGNSVSSLSDITKEITRLSTNFGVASSELITVSVTLAQAGLSAQDTKTALEALAKSALAPSFSDLNSTVEGSIALMRQFSISAEDLEASLGSINAVAAAFAVEASDIIAAIQRTGGVFASASNGVSQGKDALNEFIAVFTSVRATTREGAETIATGLRTIFTRIQRGSTIDALKEYGIVLTDLEGKFVGPYKAIELLSQGLSGLDTRDLRFSQIVEELGGFRQIGKVIPLIQQFSTAQQALAVAQGGQGSLAKNAVEAQQSLAVQFEKTRQSFVALIRDLGNSTTFKGIAKVALTTANAFITLASALKPLLPLLTALTAIKGASILSEFGSGFLGGLGKKGGGAGILGFASGGMVPGQGNRDTVAAMLTPGEYVIRKKAVEKIGAENLEQLNRGGRIKGYASGGRIEKIQAHDAYDGDSWHVSYIPESSPVGPMTSRGEGYDAYEIKKGLAWERALGQRATEIAQGVFTDSRTMSIDHSLGKSLTQGQSVGGRPVHNVPDSIINEMVDAGVAIRTSNKNNVATGFAQTEDVKAKQIKTLESMGNKKLVYDRERSKLASGGMVRKFAVGGVAEQSSKQSKKRGFFFDFDDTLAVSGAQERPGEADPYVEFRGSKGRSFVESAEATRYAAMAKKRSSEGYDVWVLTARPGDKDTVGGIKSFGSKNGISFKGIIGVGGMVGKGVDTASAKAAILSRYSKLYDDGIVFADDAQENVLAASKVPGVKTITAKKNLGGVIPAQRFLDGGWVKRMQQQDKKVLKKHLEYLYSNMLFAGDTGAYTETYDGTGKQELVDTKELKERYLAMANFVKGIKNTTRSALKPAGGYNSEELLDAVTYYQSGSGPLARAMVNKDFIFIDRQEEYTTEDVENRLKAAAQYKLPKKLYSGLGRGQFNEILSDAQIDPTVFINSPSKAVKQLFGKTVDFPTFLSTSKDYQAAEAFIGKPGALMSIDSSKTQQKGIDVLKAKQTANIEQKQKNSRRLPELSAMTQVKLAMYDNEEEMILNPNTKFKILSAKMRKPSSDDDEFDNAEDYYASMVESYQAKTSSKKEKPKTSESDLTGIKLDLAAQMLNRGGKAQKSTDMIQKFVGGGGVKYGERFATGGVVQKFSGGADVDDIKIAKSGKINKSDIAKLTEQQAAALLENPNVQSNLVTVAQLQKRIRQRQTSAKEAKALAAAQEYALVGLYGSPRDVPEKAADGATVKLIGKTLDKTLSDEYEKMMVDGFEQTVSRVGANMASRVGASAVSLDRNQMEKAGLYNAIGAYLEAAIATLGAPYDKDETNDPIDFSQGLGKAAALFGIPSDIPTDTTRTVFGKGKSPKDFLGQVNRYREQIQRFAAGGTVELFHGSNTGVDDSVLKSFKEKGALSNIAQGYGQGAGFYVFNQKARAIKQAKNRVNDPSMVAQGDRAGKPMVLSFKEVLNPETWDLDYELNKADVVNWLANNYDRIKDLVAPKITASERSTGIKEVIKSGTDFGGRTLPNNVLRIQSDAGKRANIEADNDANLNEGKWLGQIMQRLQANDAATVRAFEQEYFNTQAAKDIALKYVGSSPLQPTNIETFANGGSAEDTVPALLTPGEYVINKKAAKAIGMQKLNKLNKADRIQGFNKGGAVGYVQKFADGGSVKDDRLAYLERIAEKLGVTVSQYETAVRAEIIKRAEKLTSDKTQAQIDLSNIIVKSTGNIELDSVQAEFKEKATEAIATMYGGMDAIDPDLLETELNKIIEGMKAGMSVSELKESSDALRSILDEEITARTELVNAEEQMTKELGFLTSRMRVRDVDVRARRSVEQGKFGALDKLDLRRAQKSIETPLGRMFDNFGEMMSTRSIPGMRMLEQSFPKVAGKLTALGDKAGGITGILGAGSSLVASKIPDLANGFDHLFGTVSETSEGLAGFAGALEKAGSLGLSSAVLGQQMFGRRGAAIGGAAGLAVGATAGFIDSSIAKETENSFKRVTESSTKLNKTLDQLNNAKTVQERQMLEKEAIKNYNALNQSLENSAKTIEGNRGWKAFSAGLQGATQALITMASAAAAFGMSGGAGGFGFGGAGGGRRPRRRRRRAIGGRVGYNDGTLVPVNLAPGEGVLSPEMASRFSSIELQRLNNADRGGYGADASMLSDVPMGIVPGKGSGKVDNFKTNLAAGSYVIRSASMDALYAANGGRIGRSVVSGRGYAGGGRIKREGHYAGAAIGLAIAGFVAAEVISFAIPAISSYFDPELQKQQLQAQIDALEQLKRLTDISAAQSTQNRRYSERIIRASDPVEARDAAGQFVMSEEERQRAYGQQKTDDGRLNVLNKLAEQQARASLSAQGIIVPDSASVQEFLDTLKNTGDIDSYNKSVRLITRGHDELRKRIYLEARVREGATEIEAEKEFKRGGAKVDAKIEEEFYKQNRPDVLADRMEIVNRSINHFAANLKDVMDRVAASMRRVTSEASNLFNRLDQFTSGMVGPTATAGQARTGTADVLRNIQGYSPIELDNALIGIEQAMGNTEQVQEMGDLVRGMQLIQNELPLILRNAGGQDLEAGSTQAIDESLAKMFEGIDLGAGVEKRLRDSIMDVIQDKTGGATTQPMSFDELADQIPGLKELNATAEQARETMLQYAEAQMETINRLGQASDRLAGLMIQAAELGIRANQVQLEAALDLKKQFGETISLEELQAPFQAEINGLLATAGGNANMTPTAIADAIRDRQTQLSVMTNTPQGQMTNLENLEVARLTKEINAYQMALDKLANSTDLANAAMQKIAEQERISEGRRQGVMGFLGMVNDPEAMLGFVREQAAFTNVMGANQPGGAATLNDIVTGIQALDLVESTSTPEEFQKILQQFVQNALGVVAGAAGPQADVVRKLLEVVQKDFAVGAEQRAALDPELKANIDAYKEAIAQQTEALKAQQGLIADTVDITGSVIKESAQEFNKTILQAAKNAAAEIDAAAKRLGLQDVQPIEAGKAADAAAMRELADAAKAAAEALREIARGRTHPTQAPMANEPVKRGVEVIPMGAGKMSSGGVVYASEGQFIKGRTRSVASTPTTMNNGGMVYASKGTLVNFKPKGTDTVPAMLTRGEFVVNRSATQKNLSLLKAINNGSNVSNSGGASYASRGGIMQARGYQFGGGVIGGMLQNFVSGTNSIENVFNTFVQQFSRETNNFGDLINNLARVFPALNAPINIFGNHISDFSRAINSLKNIEIKGPNIPSTIKVNSDTIRVELIAPTDNNYKLSDEDRQKITNELQQRVKDLIALGR